MVEGMSVEMFRVFKLVLLVLAVIADGHKILLVFPIPTTSHAILGQGYVRELLKKGHEVTFVTVFPQKEQQYNLTEIDISFVLKHITSVNTEIPKVLEGKSSGTEDLALWVKLTNALTQNILKHESMQALIHDTTQQFDLVVVEWFYNELFAGSLQHEYAAAYEENYAAAAAARGVELPRFEDLVYNASLVLLNSHPSLFGSSTNLPQNVKAVGGYHIALPTKPLPQDLQEILDESKDGVIYFSMGSFVNFSMMPEETKSALLQLFKGLKQTVLWKIEDNLLNLPKNVHVSRWLPQNSILAHPNTKAFITHGGLLSTTETIHYGVPIIGVPFFGDQFLNVRRAVEKGFAVCVKASYNLADDLKTAIEEVLTNSSYAASAKRLSSLYHDRPLPPAEELMYWLEYAVRTGGAPHLRSAALLLPWYQRLYLDLLAILAATLLGLMFIVKYTFVMLRVCKQQDSKDKSE